MQNLLILTNFSEEAAYAAAYACVLAKQLGICDILLYHSTESVISPGDGVVYSGNEESLRSLAENKLSELAASIQDQAPEGCNIRYRADDILLENINDVIVQEGAEMIVMGTTGKGKLESLVAGSHSARVFEVSDVPVVLVPLQASIQPVSRIAFACDLKNVKESLPSGIINKILSSFHVPLSVVHVGESGDNEGEKAELDDMLGSFHPVYENIGTGNTAGKILAFADNDQSTLVMLVAKKHSFPMNFFHSSISKELAFESPLPLLIFREVEVVQEMPLLEI